MVSVILPVLIHEYSMMMVRPIVFWDHDIEYNETNCPEIINDSFVEFLIETIFDEEL